MRQNTTENRSKGLATHARGSIYRTLKEEVSQNSCVREEDETRVE
jgi:hypothetical protein